jgi:CheY-like chemotaxis protein
VAVVGMEAGTARQRVGSVLTRLGVRMVHADDGPTALDGSRRARPRLIVLAHFLPGLTGPEVLAELQAEPALALASTLLIGGPGSHGRHAPHPALTWGSDAWLPEDTREADIEPVVRALLGLAEGRLSPLDEQAARARARVVVADMRLYLDEQLAEGRRTGTMPPRVNAYLAAARIDFLASQPGARLHEDALRAWDEEIVRALRERPAPA